MVAERSSIAISGGRTNCCCTLQFLEGVLLVLAPCINAGNVMTATPMSPTGDDTKIEHDRRLSLDYKRDADVCVEHELHEKARRLF